MTTHADKCPVCGEGSLCERITQEAVEYKGRSELVPMLYSECNCCGSDQASPSQVRTNKRAVTAFKKRVSGLLEGREITNLRNHLRITQAEAARVFGGGPVAFSKYENDDVIQSEAMDTLIRLAVALPSAKDWLFHRQQIQSLEPSRIIDEPKLIPLLPAAHSFKRKVHMPTALRSYESGGAGFSNNRLSDYVISLGITTHENLGDFSKDCVVLIGADIDSLEPVYHMRPRVYGDEENSRHLLSREYSETDYDRFRA